MTNQRQWKNYCLCEANNRRWEMELVNTFEPGMLVLCVLKTSSSMCLLSYLFRSTILIQVSRYKRSLLLFQSHSKINCLPCICVLASGSTHTRQRRSSQCLTCSMHTIWLQAEHRNLWQSAQSTECFVQSQCHRRSDTSICCLEPASKWRVSLNPL